MTEKHQPSEHEKSFMSKYGILIVVALVAVVLFNQWQMMTIATLAQTQQQTQTVSTKSTPQNDAQLQEAIKAVIPTGTPKYGEELGVSFDNPVNSMNKLEAYDDMKGGPIRGTKAITLSPQLQQRYIKITNSISCEFCCGVPAITDSKGEPACGCAHSSAMRGLAKYLLSKHANEYTDEQILEELTKWKSLFFPKNMVERYMQQSGNLQPTDLPGMVGGC